ncbi:MAG: hypothetical protein LBH13_02295 [Cellulomonadaceae bacterium]|jgi:hypothetical protein|nr:hypothetical protein [Cellulomonadaceae bacterium]
MARGNHAAAVAILQQAELDTGVERATDLLPVHSAISPLFPHGGLPQGGVVAVHGSLSLLLATVVEASREGSWVAFVGMPQIGMVAAHDMGCALERMALIPDPGADAAAVTAALLDGIPIVVLGEKAALTPHDRRRLAARARERGAVLISNVPWPGAHVTLEVQHGQWTGCDRGAGWLQRRTVRVARGGRGAAARPITLDVEIPVTGDPVAPATVAPAAVARPPGTPTSPQRGGHLRLVA